MLELKPTRPIPSLHMQHRLKTFFLNTLGKQSGPAITSGQSGAPKNSNQTHAFVQSRYWVTRCFTMYASVAAKVDDWIWGGMTFWNPARHSPLWPECVSKDWEVVVLNTFLANSVTYCGNASPSYFLGMFLVLAHR